MKILRASAALPKPAQAPLLTAGEVAELAAQAQHWAALVAQANVHDHHAGDWPSTALGRGIDFEEARPYMPGDDLRDMDWRSTARLGHPFVKTYREERQPVWHVVVDRCPAMRFGTRRRLKAAQAARMGVLICHAAVELGVAVGASMWDEHDLYMPPRHGQHGLIELIQALTAPCPPLSVASQSNAFSTRLHALRAEMPRGAQVWLISDGQGLEEDAAASLLALSSWVRLQVVRIYDPAEIQLPSIGRAVFEDLGSGSVQWLDSRDAGLLERLHAQWQARRAGQEEQLQRCGLRPLDIATHLEDLIAEMLRHG